MKPDRLQARPYKFSLFIRLFLAGLISTSFCFATARSEESEAIGPDPEIPLSQYNRETINTENGLPGQMVLDIKQTRDGYLWIGTQAGVARYNGTDFTVFDRKSGNGLLSNQVQVVIEDRSGTLWLGTDGGGLTRIIGNRFSTFSTGSEPRLNDDAIKSLFEDSDGRIWIGTESAGVQLYDRGQLRSMGEPQGLSGRTVNAFAEDRGRRIWIATNRGLYMYRNGKIDHFSRLPSIKTADISSVIVTRAGGIWIGTRSQGICHVTASSSRCFTRKEGLIDDEVNTLFEDDHGALWIGTRGGVSRLYNGKFSSLTMREGLPHGMVRVVFEDREGSIWLGTDGGLQRLRNSRFSMLSTQNGLISNDIITVIEDHHGSIWMGTDGSGLTRYDRGRLVTYDKNSGLPSNSILALHVTSSGQFWIGTQGGGICRFSNGRFQCFNSANGLSSNVIRAIASDRQNNLWIGTSNGLNFWSRGHIRVYARKDGLPDSVITSILPGRGGILWVGTFNGGFCKFDRGKIVSYGRENGMTSESVMSLHEDEAGVLWMATFGGGVCRLKNDRISCFTTRDGLFHDDVLQIVDDKHGNLWIGSMKGIGRIPKSDFERYVRHEIPKLRPVVFDQADGLSTLEATGGTQPSAWRARDGRLWFATVGGLAVAHTSRSPANVVVPPVVIERAVFGDSSLDNPGSIVLPANVRDLQIHYTALTFAGKKNIKYRYILDGQDTEWKIGNGKAQTTYTNLAPGKYTFRVSACNNEGVWNDRTASLKIVVTPFYYETVWFYLGIVLLTGMVAYGVYMARIRSMRVRQQVLEQQVNEKTQELLEKQAKLESLNKSLRRQTRTLRTREQELKTLSENLGREVQRQIKVILAEREHYESELISAKEKAEESARLKSSILTNLSHEIRTPITAILGFSQILSEEVSPEQLEFIHYIQQSGKRLMDTLNSILDLSRLESHGFKFNLEQVDLTTTAQHSVQLFTPMARNKGINLRYSGPERSILCRLDQTAIDRILNNLIGNAVKFTDRGEVVVESSCTDDRGIIRVIDTGIGISESFLPFIFEEFKQESTGLSRSHEGSGLGLSITRKLVEAMEGEIDVKSEKNVGTEFTVTFPLSGTRESVEPESMAYIKPSES